MEAIDSISISEILSEFSKKRTWDDLTEHMVSLGSRSMGHRFKCMNISQVHYYIICRQDQVSTETGCRAPIILFVFRKYLFGNC